MKYILWSFISITLIIFIIFVMAPLRFLWHLLWHFEVISFQHATSIKDHDGKRVYLYDFGIKQFLLEVLIYGYKDKKIARTTMLKINKQLNRK